MEQVAFLRSLRQTCRIYTIRPIRCIDLHGVYISPNGVYILSTFYAGILEPPNVRRDDMPTRRAPSTTAEAANRVAAARLALAEAEKYQEDLDASSMYVALKCPVPRAVSDGSLPSVYKQLSVPTGVRCVFSVVPDSMEDPLGFSCLYPFQVVDGHSGDLKYHFMAYGACQYHLARVSPALELLSALDTASPAARATAHLCRQVVSNVCEILSQRMDLALLTAKGDAAMIRYVTQCMSTDLDGLQLQSP